MSVVSDRFLSIKVAAGILGVSKSTIHRMEKQGILPPKTKLTHKTVGWKASTWNQWMATNL
ncbi:helix-turn-helix transcriptional regulator [Pseudomonas iridis]|uniref:Helix-turn-helix transcriptional regulator n=1 Tax=Pseudomonas iridis TaxID=2710587 RepID=A0ABW8DKN9_9PSED